MNKPVVRQKQSLGEKPPAAKKSRKRTAKKSPTPKKLQDSLTLKHRLLLLSIEMLGLVASAVSLIIFILGYSADWFSGTHFFSSLLPFAAGVFLLVLLAALCLIGWWKARKWLQTKTLFSVPMVAICLAILMAWFIAQDNFAQAFGHFKVLVGGKQEASRVTLAHQVYAAYRRYDSAQLQHMVDRAQAFSPAIEEAAKAFRVDVNLLYGLAATESSFLPRDSKDGGRGLFQITLVPKTVMQQAARRLAVAEPLLQDHRHNAFVAAAALKYYLSQMRDDLFLGLLAYNIGPANGGLRFIMQQYGATDFITAQPYLQQYPRDYPVRVLSYALAFKVWQKEGKLLAYEEGSNAMHIQGLGIPGLEYEF
jgi:hypothetical protein